MVRTRAVVGRTMVAVALMAATATVAAPAAAAGPLGQQLRTYSAAVPGGVLQVTEFEGGTTFVGVLASCNIGGTAYKPYKSGSRIYSKATFYVTGCSIYFYKIHTISVVGIDYTPVVTSTTRWKAPVSATSSISMACRSETYATTLAIDGGTGNRDFIASSAVSIRC